MRSTKAQRNTPGHSRNGRERPRPVSPTLRERRHSVAASTLDVRSCVNAVWLSQPPEGDGTISIHLDAANARRLGLMLATLADAPEPFAGRIKLTGRARPGGFVVTAIRDPGRCPECEPPPRVKVRPRKKSPAA
jgi:hypothetical protein